jgi:hypothetical protein
MSSTPHFVYRLLEQLDAAKIHYSLFRIREDTIMIEAHVPGRRAETIGVSFLSDVAPLQGSVDFRGC